MYSDPIYRKLIELDLIQWLDSEYDQSEKITIFNRYSKSPDATSDGAVNIVKYLWSPSYANDTTEYFRLINQSFGEVTNIKLMDVIVDAYQHLIGM